MTIMIHAQAGQGVLDSVQTKLLISLILAIFDLLFYFGWVLKNPGSWPGGV